MIKISPTKNNLFKTRAELGVAEEGYDLLKQKREVLVMDLMRLFYNIRRTKNELRVQLKNSITYLKEYKALKGQQNLRSLQLAVKGPLKVELKERSVMGVPLIKLMLSEEHKKPHVGLLNGCAYLDHILLEIPLLSKAICEHIGDYYSLKRVSIEVKKTQRREKALENLFIPTYHSIIKYIQDSLEENDRSEFVLRKRVKKLNK